MIKAGALERSGESGSEEDDDDADMEVDTSKQTDEVKQALAVAEALGRPPKNNKPRTKLDDITDGLKELDMDNYDEENEGIELFSKGLGDLYYPSNDMDPYLKDKDSSTKYKEGSHTDSVLGLAWNKHYRNILASASADRQVKIWNVATGKCDITMEHHTDKVQAVAWNHHEPQVLLSGSFDNSVATEPRSGNVAIQKDGRIPTHPGFKWSVAADVESLAWDSHSNHSFVVSLEDGTVQGFDIRTASSNSVSDLKPSFTLHAHDKAVCSVSYNRFVPNLLATGSTDKMVKLWDLSNNQPACVASKNPKTDSPFLLAMGGSKGKLEVWDTLSDAGISERSGNYMQHVQPSSS
ncbi:hypothetical protein JCGZ_05674 [Jatropha curcas]|uniref:Uncharacterized protein n=1 Tax=Jatropha curcas TaxID=180498 RepID=A0A067L749_JATCU|nr:hypothetical protein JCGZ_05674 [Jatropha curcas]